MEEAQAHASGHVVAFPFPAQGHITPLLQFSKRLATKGVGVTLINPMSTNWPPDSFPHLPNLRIHNIQFHEGAQVLQGAGPDEYMNCFKYVYLQRLADFLDCQTRLGNPVHYVVYDSHVPWVLNMARSRGIDAAPFFTQPWAVCAVYYHIHEGTFKAPLDEEELPLQLPAMPSLEADDVPSFTSKAGHDAYPRLIPHVVGQLSNVKEADFIFCNTFQELEHELITWMRSQDLEIKTVGPTIPSMYLDKRLQDDTDYGLCLLEPNFDECIKWLDSKDDGSVVYVAFGSLAALGEVQMHELAWGLKRNTKPFLWVVRETEQRKLPRDFIRETTEQGLVVSWSPQLQVLAHRAVGCFVTHCGWNSVLEALSLGVPMVGMPQWTDQPTNAKFVADVWRVGVRVRVDESGMSRREEIEESIREVMRNMEIKENCRKWKEMAVEAVGKGGSSDKNIDDFVEKLVMVAAQSDGKK